MDACKEGNKNATVRVNDPETSKEICDFGAKAADDIMSEIDRGNNPDPHELFELTKVIKTINSEHIEDVNVQ
jgi:hypothetical protein